MTARRRVHPLVEQLIEERHLLDLSRPEIAHLAGVSVRGVNALETGANTPRLGTLELIARALGYRVALIHVGDKQCRTCKEIKPIRRFGRDRHKPDGLAAECGSCTAQRYHETVARGETPTKEVAA